MSEFDDRIEELLALAALGELTEADEVELDAALANADVAAELDADLQMAATLQSVHRTDPPAALKADVMAAIDSIGQDESGDGADAVAFPPPTADAVTPGSPVAPVKSFEAARNRRARRWQPMAAAAAIVMLVAGGVFVAARQADNVSSIDAVVQADDVQERRLEGELGGTLDVVFSPSQAAFVLAGNDIPVLTDAQTYQLWFVDDVGATSVGLFRPDGSGRVSERFDDLDPTEFIVGVTVEPAGGSDGPTLPIVAAA